MQAPSSYEGLTATYHVESGACKSGFDLPLNHAARRAFSIDACTQACTDYGTECVSASWFAKGRTLFKQVRSQCWLSTTCSSPDCCQAGFNTYIKRFEHGSASGSAQKTASRKITCLMRDAATRKLCVYLARVEAGFPPPPPPPDWSRAPPPLPPDPLPSAAGRTALVMSDSRNPWPPDTTNVDVLERWMNMLYSRDYGVGDLYYSLAVALASLYARRHCYDMRIFRFHVNRGKKGSACVHPTLGHRAVPWCKLISVHHTLWERTTSADGRAAWMYQYVVYLDSDLFFHDPSRSIPALLDEYTGPGALASQRPFVREPFAWFASNWPFLPSRKRTNGSYTTAMPGRAHANSAFFVLRNGAAAKDLISTWWSQPNATKFNYNPWWEQVRTCLVAAPPLHHPRPYT